MLALGPGPFVHALEYATDSNAILVGKPNPGFFRSAIDDQTVSPSEVVMIGDVSCMKFSLPAEKSCVAKCQIFSRNHVIFIGRC